MKSRSHQLADRFQDLYLSGKWIANTNYKEQLLATKWEEATQKVASLNTIALLTFHINYYIKGLLDVFNGQDLTIQDKYSFDCPPIRSTSEWQTLRDTLITNAEAMTLKIKAMSDHDLEANFVQPEYGSNEKNLEALIEHGYYHLGQISLLKKLI